MGTLVDPAYVAWQYRDASNLQARIDLHACYSANAYGWQRWVFDQLHLAGGERVLELGCGAGDLWLENAHRLPAINLTLTDNSPGMLSHARDNLRGSVRAAYGVVDAQAIPHPARTIDVTIANHMLYHVPDLPRTLGEIRRVLTAEGRLATTTVGRHHMRELDDLLRAYDPAAQLAREQQRDGALVRFNLDTAPEILERYFGNVSVHRYDDALVVNEVGPLVDYVLSTAAGRARDDAWARGLAAHLERELARRGAIHITKESGFFLCRSR